MKKTKKIQTIQFIFTAIIMMAGLFIFKYMPMKIFGGDILFDASMHIVVACFALYFIYLFVDENKKWHIPYFILSLAVLLIISFQRLLVNAHNDIGLLIGLALSLVAILAPRYKEVRLKW